MPFSNLLSLAYILSKPLQMSTCSPSRILSEPLQMSTSLHRQDSLDLESARVKSFDVNGPKVVSWAIIFQLAFQSLGVVYGDLGTSPLYVFAGAFGNGIKNNDDIIGVLSLILYTFSLLPIIKYVFIVLRANDNGNGGTFALYSLLCRHIKMGLLPNTQTEDTKVSNYNLSLPDARSSFSYRLKSALENSICSKFALLFITMFSTSLVISDGIITPCMSVLSAVGGIKLATTAMTDERVVWITVVIIVLLFSVQRLGTNKVGYTFSPILLIWFILNTAIGIYNFIKYDPTVVKAFNPSFIYEYFKRNGKDAWISLGGVVLCITGTEALFADLAHFTVLSIRISTCCVVYPSIIITYAGQASYLRHHPQDVSQTYYKAIPGPMYWPMFVVAVLATIIASQSMITGTFSIIQQSLSLGCFPRVSVVHTSPKYEGQVYIPEVNYFLMIACVCVTLVFKTAEKIGNAYGIAVVLAETITSVYMVLVMILIWKKHVAFIIAYVAIILSVEYIYLSSVLYKFSEGGYFPFTLACLLMLIMVVWNYVYRHRYYYEMKHKVTNEQLQELMIRPTVCKVTGVAIFYSELAHGIPPIFQHYATNIPALQSVLIFVSFKCLPISKVPSEERFLFRRVHVKEEYLVFRCVVRYGYTDLHDQRDSLEHVLLVRIKDFVREDSILKMVKRGSHCESDDEVRDNVVSRAEEEEEERRQKEVDAVVEALEVAEKAGVVHLMGEGEVIAAKGSSVWKKIGINYGYNFMKKNLKRTDKVYDVPREKLLKVGMLYEV